MAVPTKGLSSRAFLQDKADSSALRVGTTKENSTKNRPRVEGCLPSKGSDIAMRANGKVIYLTVKAVRLGQSQVMYHPTRDSMWLVRNMARGYTNVETNGSTREIFLTMS